APVPRFALRPRRDEVRPRGVARGHPEVPGGHGRTADGPRRTGLAPHIAVGLGRVKPAPFEYHAPDTAVGAARLLRDLGDEAKVIAGGQSLVPMMALRLAR